MVMGGATPIVSVLIGDEADTLNAGKFLFDQGYYVQSVLFPAVPYHCGVLRVQCNANHEDASIDGLIDAFAVLNNTRNLPRCLEKSSAFASHNGHAGNGPYWNGNGKGKP